MVRYERLSKNNKELLIKSDIKTGDLNNFVEDENTILFMALNDDVVCGYIYGYVLKR